MMKKSRNISNLNSSPPPLFLVTEQQSVWFFCEIHVYYLVIILSFLTVEFIISKLENVNREGQRREHKATVFWTGFWILYLLISYAARDRISSKRPEIFNYILPWFRYQRHSRFLCSRLRESACTMLINFIKFDWCIYNCSHFHRIKFFFYWNPCIVFFCSQCYIDLILRSYYLIALLW